jgi:hypothetical protein
MKADVNRSLLCCRTSEDILFALNRASQECLLFVVEPLR